MYRSWTKPDPEKYCAYCGKQMHRVRFDSGRLEDYRAFLRRKYCNRDCMKKAFVKVGVNDQLYRPAHHTASHLAYDILGKPRVCEKCGSTQSIDVHHIDGNYNNNTPENIMILCRSCHMKEHRPKSVCKVCGRPATGHGYCDKHYQRFKKYGTPYMCNHKIVSE